VPDLNIPVSLVCPHFLQKQS